MSIDRVAMPLRVPLVIGCLLAGAMFSIATSVASAGGEPIYAESFDGPDGSPWPDPWFAATEFVTVADIQGNRARLGGDAQHVARMILPGFTELDAEVEVTIEFEAVELQGAGVYIRQNGGYLQDTVPFGQGYGAFIKGPWAWPDDLGLWAEVDGVETQFEPGYDPIVGGFQNNTPYRLRYQTIQESPTETRVRAKIWELGTTEPDGWFIETLNSIAALQEEEGSFALDLFNASGSAAVYFDDLVIRSLGSATAVPGPAFSDGLKLAVSPNPIVPTSQIEFFLPQPGELTIGLYDVSGRLQVNLLRRYVTSERTSVSWPELVPESKSLAEGVYFVRATILGQTFVARVTIQE